MIQRCNNPNNYRYQHYGGRGVSVCQEWQKSFAVFLQDMGNRPKGYTLERKNNDGNYCKENCKWATYTEQNRNQQLRRTNKTGFKGVHWHVKCQKYRVQIEVNGKCYHIGLFEKVEDAAIARQNAEIMYWK